MGIVQSVVTAGTIGRRGARVRAWALAALAAATVALLLGGAAPTPAASVPPSQQRWAVLVGVNDYAGRTVDTVGSVGDVRDLRQVLVAAGWPESNIVELTERHASAASIRDALRWLAAKSSSGSMSVFHYSGHVKQLGGDRDRDGEALDEYLWSQDNQFISDRELTESLHRVQGRVWVDIAGCEAAGFDDGLSGPRHLFTASSREPEKSYEQPKWGNSVYSGLMIDQGMLRRAAQADADGRISIQAAFAYAAHHAPQITKGQSHGPQHPVMAGGDGQPWHLASPPPPPEPPPTEERRCFLLCLGG